MSERYDLLMAACVANGFICLAIFSVAYELGVETSFPIGEATSQGLTNSIANVIGFALDMAITPILDRN